MSKWWASAFAIVALVIGLGMVAPMPAQAETATDSCGSTSGPPDLATATFTYSASSFSLGAGLCPQPVTYGEYLVTLHLTSFTPEVQITAAFQDLGKYLGYSGFRACVDAVCTADENGSGFLTPSGVRLDGPCLYDPYNCYARSAYGGWSEFLAKDTSIPDTITWYADVRVRDAATHQWTDVPDRLPDSGTVLSSRNTATVATQVSAAPGAAPTWYPYGAIRTDVGRLTTQGGAVVDRLVRVQPVRYDDGRKESSSSGAWSTTYALDLNTTVRACFSGDGVHDPSCSAPYPAYVKAFVSLDLPPSKTVPRGTPLVLRGVVRPHATGEVRVLIREDRPGTSYRLLRYTNLIRNGDTYYRTSWSPTVRGRYVLRTVWNGGSTADGAVLSHISDYRRVTVT